MGQLASTLDEVEKIRVEKLALQFLNQHHYFLRMWKMLSDSQKRQVLNIIDCRKGVIPYKKINSINGLSLKAENGIFFKKCALQYLKRKNCK